MALRLSCAELAERAELTVNEVERIEESGIDPASELVSALTGALC
ncbi:MAG TPA: hypothetical protein VIU15_35610 [Streptomyces sp.]